jgi:hypothetical protein
MPEISPVNPPALPAVAERGGTQLRTPLPVLVVDTREQDPLDFEPYQFSAESLGVDPGDEERAGLSGSMLFRPS